MLYCWTIIVVTLHSSVLSFVIVLVSVLTLLWCRLLFSYLLTYLVIVLFHIDVSLIRLELFFLTFRYCCIVYSSMEFHCCTLSFQLQLVAMKSRHAFNLRCSLGITGHGRPEGGCKWMQLHPLGYIVKL